MLVCIMYVSDILYSFHFISPLVQSQSNSWKTIIELSWNEIIILQIHVYLMI